MAISRAALLVSLPLLLGSCHHAPAYGSWTKRCDPSLSTRPLGIVLRDTALRDAIAGQITTVTGAPLVAAVKLGPPDRVILTDHNGMFRLADLPPGSYVVSVRAVGYIGRVDTLSVSAVAGTRLRLPLAEYHEEFCQEVVMPVQPWWRRWWPF